MFNFKYIKDKASPGSWRRGYEYYKKDMVMNTNLEGNTISAKVKGKFQSDYDISLTIEDGEVKANCSCPLEEEWCKHAVSVGLTSIKEHYYGKHKAEENKEEFVLPLEEFAPELTEYQGSYKFILGNMLPKSASLRIVDRVTGKPVVNVKPILTAIKELMENEENPLELNEFQQNELNLFKFIHRNAKYDKKSRWQHIPLNNFPKVLSLLAKVEEVFDVNTNERLIFGTEPWKLLITVNVSVVGNVMLSSHWERPDTKDLLPFNELKYFTKRIKWGRYKNFITPTDTALSTLPAHLTRSSFFDIRDADGGKFIYEELPKLRKSTTVEVSEDIEKISLEESKPRNVLSIELTPRKAIRASLEFEYDGIRVPYGKLANKTPYVTIKKPKKDIIYWVKRNLKLEEQAYQMLIAARLIPTQTNNLIIEEDSAIDFYYIIKNTPIGDEWIFEETNDLSELKSASSPLELIADVQFCDGDVEKNLEMKLSARVGKTEVTLETLQEGLYQGKKYYNIEGEGFVEIPVAKILHLTKSLNNFDAERIDDNTFSIKTYRVGFIAELKEHNYIINMSPKFEKFWNQINTFSTLEEITLPKKLKADLRDYQKKGFYWLWFLYQYGLNGILADDMGLGKTLQALTLILKAKEEHGSHPTLVVCPTSVVFNWEDEIEKFTPSIKCLNLTGVQRKDQFSKIDSHDVIITSYALIRRDIAKLKKHNFRFLILDESQNIKNHESLTAKSAKNIPADHKIALSGTPIENKLSELWSVFDFLMPEFLYDVKEFEGRYITPIEQRADKTVGQRLKMQIYPFILRRLKSDIAKDLPDKIEHVSYCKMTPAQKELYLETLDKTREEVFNQIADKGFNKSRMSIFSAILRLRQICNHPYLYDKEHTMGVNESGKFEQLKIMLEDVISNGHRILLFSQFVEMLKLVKNWLEEKGYKYEYLTGESKAEGRGDKVKRFNEDDTIPIFLISLKAGGTGLNLTGADYVIHYDPWWNPAVEDQATDRAHRIGQTKNVFVYRLITKGTVEEKIMKLKERKRDLVDSIISVDRNIGKSLTFDDLKDIFTPE